MGSETGKQAGGNLLPAPHEIHLRRKLGILILLLSFSCLVVGFLFVPVALATGWYLRRNRGYHLFADLFLVLAGIIFYTTNIPLFAPPPWFMRVFLLNFSLSGLPFAVLLSLAFIEKILILSSALYLLAGDLLVRLGPSFPGPERASFPRVILPIFALLAVIPLFLPLGLATGPEGSWSSGGCPPSLDAFSMEGDSITLIADPEAGRWTYRITARNRLDREASILRITGQKPFPGLLGSLNLLSRTVILAPPYHPGIEVNGGVRTEESILVRPGETAVIRILSDEPIFSLTILDSGGCEFSRSFLAPAGELPDYTIDATPAYDPGVRILLTEEFPPGSDPGKTVFHPGENIYLSETGLPAGTGYGFQVKDSGGRIFVWPPLRMQQMARVKTGTGPETSGTFNTRQDPLEPGEFTVELVRFGEKKGWIIASVNLSVIPA
ncbi:MAG: hypothetical protein ACM3X8_00835 [Methanomicrobiales archaeon]